MSYTAVQVERVSKRYRLGATAGYDTLREALMHQVQRWTRGRRGEPAPEIDALKDVSFRIQAGEVVGVIGRNGAGKSTLLKILSRITEPTHGRVELRGRVGSLLEVGTGFHPELTGRDNIFLSGAILGMKREEIRKRFDAIVAFAEVDRFLDTPVKRYSSGMFVRLAFAVAAYLEPEIMLVDEVLAVGDARFQKKCFEQMHDRAAQGRTVLFVSHNMQATSRLCPRAILFEQGQIVADGPTVDVVRKYLNSESGTSASRHWPENDAAPGNAIVRLRAARIRDEAGAVNEIIDIREGIRIELEFEILEAGHLLLPNFHLLNEDGLCVFVAGDQDAQWRRKPRPKGRYVSTAYIPGQLLSEGRYSVQAALSTLEPLMVHACERDAVGFQVVDRQTGDTARGDYVGPMPGVIRPLLKWTTDYRPAA